jgi:hypothetical protein
VVAGIDLEWLEEGFSLPDPGLESDAAEPWTIEVTCGLAKSSIASPWLF